MPDSRHKERAKGVPVPLRHKVTGILCGLISLISLGLAGFGVIYMMENLWGGRTWEIGTLSMAAGLGGLLFGGLAWYQFRVSPRRDAEIEAYQRAVRQRMDAMASQYRPPEPRVDSLESPPEDNDPRAPRTLSD